VQGLWKHDFFESKPNGRLCAWEPATKKAREVLGDMYFANGIAVDPGQEFVLVTRHPRRYLHRLERHLLDRHRLSEGSVDRRFR
jgi:sugar lactone lactonase YvrE